MTEISSIKENKESMLEKALEISEDTLSFTNLSDAEFLFCGSEILNYLPSNEFHLITDVGSNVNKLLIDNTPKEFHDVYYALLKQVWNLDDKYDPIVEVAAHCATIVRFEPPVFESEIKALVTVEDFRKNLEKYIEIVANGDEVLIADGEKTYWLAPSSMLKLRREKEKQEMEKRRIR